MFACFCILTAPCGGESQVNSTVAKDGDILPTNDGESLTLTSSTLSPNSPVLPATNKQKKTSTSATRINKNDHRNSKHEEKPPTTLPPPLTTKIKSPTLLQSSTSISPSSSSSSSLLLSSTTSSSETRASTSPGEPPLSSTSAATIPENVNEVQLKSLSKKHHKTQNNTKSRNLSMLGHGPLSYWLPTVSNFTYIHRVKKDAWPPSLKTCTPPGTPILAIHQAVPEDTPKGSTLPEWSEQLESLCTEDEERIYLILEQAPSNPYFGIDKLSVSYFLQCFFLLLFCEEQNFPLFFVRDIKLMICYIAVDMKLIEDRF